MRASRPKQRVAELPVRQIVVARQPEVAAHLGHEPGDREVAESLTRQPRQRGGNVDRPHVVGERHRPVDSAFQRIEERGREQVLVLNGQILIARMLLRDRHERLGRWHAVHLAIVERVAREEAVAAFEPVVDAQLAEVLVGRLCLGEQIFGGAATERTSVRVRKQRVEKLRNLRMERHRSRWQDAEPRIVVRHRGQARHAEPLDERFERREVERLVLHHRAARHRPEMVPVEIWRRFVLRIEVVLRVERRVPVELEARSVHRVRAGSRDGVDHAAGGASELRGVRVGQHLELQDRLDAEQHAR